MLGHHEYYSDALFSIETNTTDPDAPNVSIRGGRYDEFLYQKLAPASRLPAQSLLTATLNNQVVYQNQNQ